MAHQKFRLASTLSFTFAALLTLPSASIAQTQTGAGDSAARPASALLLSTFHFTDGGNDIPGRLTTDAAGNFYVSATIKSTAHVSGFAVLKYDANGTLQRVFRPKPAPVGFTGSANAVKLDKQNNLFAVGSNFTGLVISFTPAGAQRWTAQFDLEPIALAIDATGDVYVAGNGDAGGSDGVGPITDWLLVKYSNTGKVLWEQHHTGTVGLDSRVTDIQLDPSGNPIVFGTTSNNPANLTNRTTVAKYDPQGDLLWAKDFAEPNTSQIAGGLAIDPAGSVYTTSTTNPPEGIATPITVKYDPNGVIQFLLQGNGAGGRSIAIDPAGDILLTGATVNFGTQTFIAASKFHPSGAKVWVTQIPQTGKIVSDSTGNAFVAGSGFVITKLNSKGKILFSSSILPGDLETDAVVDPFGNLLVTGFGQNAQFGDDIFTVRLK